MTEPGFLILVVDDHEPNRDLLSRRLERHGYTVVAAASGADALRLLGEQPIDLMVLDVMMPGMSGLEVLDAVRGDRPAAELPVIMATARAESEDLVAALDRGASDYVTKPIQIDILLARMRVQLRDRTPAARRPAAATAAAGAAATPIATAAAVPEPNAPQLRPSSPPPGSPAVEPPVAAALVARVSEADADASLPGVAAAEDSASAAPAPGSAALALHPDALDVAADRTPAEMSPPAGEAAAPLPVVGDPAHLPEARPGHVLDRPPTPVTVALGDGPRPTASEEIPERWLGPGALIDGRYRLDTLLGQGGFGAVYRGFHLVLETPVAIKFLHQSLVTSGSMLRRFQIEGISACRVRHPNAVAVLDAGSFNGFPYLVMELLEGPALSAVLEKEHVLPMARCAAVIAPVCEVLIEAHRAGIVHRDIKPANILLSQTPRGELVKVLDFGVAHLVEGGPRRPLMSRGESLIGTPQYMAPERLMGQTADARSDLYSVGATLYEMMTGDLPWGRSSNLMAQAYRQVQFEPTHLRKHRGDLPEPLADLLTSAIARDPAARPSLETLRDGLVSWAARWSEPDWPPQGLGVVAATSTTLVLAESDVVSEGGASSERGSGEDPDLR